MTDKKAELRKVLEEHFDPGVAACLADRVQNACSKGTELRVEEADDCFIVLLDNDEPVIATLTRGEAVLLCADIKNALTLTE